jgi:hypothetical protein
MIVCTGYDTKTKQYLMEESEPGLRLKFKGADAKSFRQSNPPKGRSKSVDFIMGLDYLLTEHPGFLPVIQSRSIRKGSSRIVPWCPSQLTH